MEALRRTTIQGKTGAQCVWPPGVIAWQYFLCAVAILNITAWSLSAAVINRRHGIESAEQLRRRRTQLLLSSVYVFGCAFRSALPVYDIPRIVLVDSWLSSIAIGRSVATLAELCFAAQWALLLRESALDSQDRFAERLSKLIVPLIAIAEVCSWSAVLTTANLGHVAENSLWGVSAALVVIGLARRLPDSPRSRRPILLVWCVAGAAYVSFMLAVDVPMYWERWLADEASGRQYFTLAQGMLDVVARRVVSRDWDVWSSEVAWMSLYFSAGVWSSISLIYSPRVGVPAGSRTDQGVAFR